MHYDYEITLLVCGSVEFIKSNANLTPIVIWQ